MAGIVWRLTPLQGRWPRHRFWTGPQPGSGAALDEVAYRCLSASPLLAALALDLDPDPLLVRRAAVFLVRNGPLTQLDRWEDAGGLSPSTLAVAVAALVAAAEMAHGAGEHIAAAHFLAVADYWADRVEAWCYSRERGPSVRPGSDPETGPGPDAAHPHPGHLLCFARVVCRHVHLQPALQLHGDVPLFRFRCCRHQTLLSL